VHTCFYGDLRMAHCRWWRGLHGPEWGTSRVGLMRWSLHFGGDTHMDNILQMTVVLHMLQWCLPYVEETTSWMMVCCRGRQRFQVEENVRTSGCGCDGRRADDRAQAWPGTRARWTTVCDDKCDVKECTKKWLSVFHACTHVLQGVCEGLYELNMEHKIYQADILKI